MALGNVLVVEDLPRWQALYERNVQPFHGGVLRVAATLGEADEAIKEMAFAVAFVDIRLEEGDAANRDGLKVLDRLSKSTDHTSAVMITSHGTVEMTRDVMKQYGAFDAREKEKLELRDIAQLVEDGTNRRNDLAASDSPRAADVLRGRRPVWDWDAEMMQATGGRGGAQALYDFLQSLTARFIPLVGGDGSSVSVEEGRKLATGVFWSRSIGTAVGLVFGSAEALHEARRDLGAIFGAAAGEILHEREKGGTVGVVVELERRRDTFG